jgi:hypothetical protein
VPQKSDFANSMQERVHRRLGLVGAGPAAFFRDACRLAIDPARLSTTTHLIGHLLREVEGNLLDVLHQQLVAPLPTVTQLPPADLVPAKVAPQTKSRVEGELLSDATQPGSARAEAEGLEGEAEELEGTNDLIKVAHKTKVRAILTALSFPLDGPEALQWLSMARGKRRLHRVAHRNNLNPPRPPTDVFFAEFEAVVQLFDAVLERFEARYAKVYTQLDVLLARPEPGADGIALLGKAIPNTPRTLGYFFERLPHVGWLEPLRRAGFLRAPPLAAIDAEGRTIGSPHWSAADYLARVAASRQSVVASILEEAAAETENIRVQAQMIELMLLLRAEDRARLALAVKRWVPGLARCHWGDQAPIFAAVLARDGSVDLAFELTAVVLDLPDADPDTGRRPLRVAEYRGNSQEVAWHLREAATTLIPALLEADGLRALSLFADALDYHAGRRPDDAEARSDTPEGLTDYSVLWADDLGREDGRDASDLRVYLTHVTLNATRDLGMRTPERLADVMGVLRQRGARVLRRIELAALATLVTSGDAVGTGAALSISIDRLTMRQLVIEDEIAMEWAGLLAAVFPRLASVDRARVLAAIEPPDFSWMQHEEYAVRRAAAWRRDRLAIIAEFLDADASTELTALIEAQGAAESVRNRGWRGAVWSGPTSPIDAAALRDMDAEALGMFLQRWEPQQGFAEPTPEGLGRQIAKMIEENPGRYAPWAARFIGLAPTYVRSFLDGIAAAVRAERAFPWEEVLELAGWVLQQPAPESDMSAASLDVDPDWRAARQTVSGLLGLGLSLEWNEQNAIPIAERDRIWLMIERLSEDVNPSPEYEERNGRANMDPAMLALNTIRPKAVDAAIHYAYWVAKHGAQSNAGLRSVLTTSPEVATVLERRLDPSRDPSLAVRAAIGRWLGTLARTDPDWVRGHLPILLSANTVERTRRDALWDAYVQWSEPHPDVLPVLEPYYRLAAERTGADRGAQNIQEKPDDRLAEHVMALYWWGALLLDSNSLVAHFFTHADAARRKHAVRHIGFSLFHTEKPVPVEPLERLRQLWEWLFPQLAAEAANLEGQASARAALSELEEFGWWFASAAFAPKWALDQLHKVLRLTGRVELEHAVAERLSELSSEHPGAAVRCLAEVNLAGNEPWTVRRLVDQAPTILANALAADDRVVRDQARELVNRFVAAGYPELRSLLRD